MFDQWGPASGNTTVDVVIAFLDYMPGYLTCQPMLTSTCGVLQSVSLFALPHCTYLLLLVVLFIVGTKTPAARLALHQKHRIPY
jgi:hypothetical protein